MSDSLEKLMRTCRSGMMAAALLMSAFFPHLAWGEDLFSEQQGGVPVLISLSTGFGEDFSDDNFIVINGFGAMGIWEFWSSDVWLTGGLYTGIAFAGDLINKDTSGDANVNLVRDLPSEGWGINPGMTLGMTIGLIPKMDVHLLGYVGPSFALLSRFQEQRAEDGALQRVRIDEIDGKLGFSYGGLVSAAYTGNIPWLRGMSLGLDIGYHENTFDRWHFGFTIGIAF